jgi:hypothetical protein
MHVVPTTGAGRWSVALLVGFVLGLGAFAALVAGGQRGGEEYYGNWWLAAPFTAAVLAAVGAAWTGWLAIIARSERSLLVYLSAAVGSLVTAFAALEVTFPH